MRSEEEEKEDFVCVMCLSSSPSTYDNYYIESPTFTLNVIVIIFFLIFY